MKIAGSKKRFSKIYIEISNLCNLQCSFCPEVLRDKKIMTAAQFNSVIESIVPFTDRITLHLMGEPLLHPQFVEIMAMVNASSLALELTTNAILLTKYSDLILQSKAIRQINFSLQSYLDNFPDRPMDNYLVPIFNFINLALIHRPDLYINFRLWNLPAVALNTADVQSSDLVMRKLLELLTSTFQGQLPDFIDVRSKKSWKLTEKVRIHWDTRFDWPSLANKEVQPNGFCYGLDSHIGIHADGTVVPCCLDKEANIRLGNILEVGLTEILNTERARSIVSHFSRGIACEELCQKCSFKDRFKDKIKNKIKIKTR